jgi:methyl-accepting chemotaxis protein
MKKWVGVISDASVKTKLYSGFFGIVAVFAIAAVYQVSALSSLRTLQAEEASRSEDAMKVKDILKGVDTCYTVILQGILNRDIISAGETRKELDKIKSETHKDIQIVKAKAGTAQEKELAAQLEQRYTRYIDVFEKKLLPQLEKGEAADLNEIRDIEQQIDSMRADAGTGLDGINRSFAEKARDGDKRFKAVASSAKTVVIAVTAICFILAGCIALYIVRDVLARLGAEPSILVEITRKIADGDLTMRIDANGSRQGSLAVAIGVMVEKLQTVLALMRSTADKVASASHELSGSADQLAKGSGNQMEKAQQTAVASEEMTRTITGVARNSASIADASHETATVAKNGETVVNSSVREVKQIACMVAESAGRIKELGERSRHIGDIVGVINDIADQTNLLALNAAIEAARAGEQGRGFAVVADEVKKLAEKTASSTNEIGGMIQAIRDDVTTAVASMDEVALKVEAGVALSEKGGDSLTSIVAAAESLDAMVQSIAAATEQMAATSEQIARDTETVRGVAGEAVSSTQQVLRVAKGLAADATEMQEIVGQFKM